MPGFPVAAEREGHSEGLTRIREIPTPTPAFLRLRR